MSKNTHPNLLFIRKGSAWVLVANVNNYSQLAIRNGQLFAKDVVKHKVQEARLKLRAAVNRRRRLLVNRAKPWLKVID